MDWDIYLQLEDQQTSRIWFGMIMPHWTRLWSTQESQTPFVLKDKKRLILSYSMPARIARRLFQYDDFAMSISLPLSECLAYITTFITRRCNCDDNLESRSATILWDGKNTGFGVVITTSPCYPHVLSLGHLDFSSCQSYKSRGCSSCIQRQIDYYLDDFHFIFPKDSTAPKGSSTYMHRPR